MEAGFLRLDGAFRWHYGSVLFCEWKPCCAGVEWGLFSSSVAIYGSMKPIQEKKSDAKLNEPFVVVCQAISLN